MSVLSLADAKDHLNLTGGDSDTEVASFIDAAEAAIGARIGPLGTVTRTDRVRGAGKELMVSSAPMITLVSVAPVGGTALDPTSMVVDFRAGVIAYVAATQYNFARFPLPWYDVTYTAGWNVSYSTYPDLYLAIKEMVRHLWQTQRGGTKRPSSGAGGDSYANTLPGAAFAFPFRVEQLIAPYVQTGFA